MERSFGQVLSELRSRSELSQRTLASDLKISQALLSHYENGTREPGLPFICRACDYFGVSADYMLGRTDDISSGGAVGCPQYTQLNQLLVKANRPALREAAADYLNAASGRIFGRLSPMEDGEQFLCSQAVQMAQAELHLAELIAELRSEKAQTHK